MTIPIAEWPRDAFIPRQGPVPRARETMSDLLTIRGIDTEAANEFLRAWARSKPWARSAQVCRRWEPAELEVGGRNAIRFMKGKHKRELAELVLALGHAGGQLIRVKLRDDQRLEQDLGDWARRTLARQRDRAT